MDPYSEPKRAKSESQDGSVSWTSRPVAYSNAKQRRAEARARGRNVHYGQPRYVADDQSLIQGRIELAKATPWSEVEALLEPEPIFTPETIGSNPSYDGEETPIEDEPDSYDVLQQPSWDWRLLKVFWDTAFQHNAAGDPRIAPGAYPSWFKSATVMERMIVLRKPKRSLLMNIRGQRKIATNLGNKDRMPDFGTHALQWLYGNTWPYGKDAEKLGDDGEDYTDYPPNVSDYRTFLAYAEPAWVKYLLALREVAIVRASVLCMPTDRRFSEGSFLRAVIRRTEVENEDRVEIEGAEKDFELLNLWARPRWLEACLAFDEEARTNPPLAGASASSTDPATALEMPQDDQASSSGSFSQARPPHKRGRD